MQVGDDIWSGLFGKYFDKMYPYPSFNVRDLDSLDDYAFKHLHEEIKKDNFTLLVGHVIGIDHAGHSFDSSNSEVERKIHDIET